MKQGSRWMLHWQTWHERESICTSDRALALALRKITRSRPRTLRRRSSLSFRRNRSSSFRSFRRLLALLRSRRPRPSRLLCGERRRVISTCFLAYLRLTLRSRRSSSRFAPLSRFLTLSTRSGDCSSYRGFLGLNPFRLFCEPLLKFSSFTVFFFSPPRFGLLLSHDFCKTPSCLVVFDRSNLRLLFRHDRRERERRRRGKWIKRGRGRWNDWSGCRRDSVKILPRRIGPAKICLCRTSCRGRRARSEP